MADGNSLSATRYMLFAICYQPLANYE